MIEEQNLLYQRKNVITEFVKFDKKPFEISLFHNTFTDPELRSLLRTCTSGFVNNAEEIFSGRSVKHGCRTLDYEVSLLICGLAIDSRIATLSKLIDLQSDPVRQCFHEEIFTSGPDACSWTLKPLRYFVYTKKANEWTCEKCTSKNQLISMDEELGESICKSCTVCEDDPNGYKNQRPVLRTKLPSRLDTI